MNNQEIEEKIMEIRRQCATLYSKGDIEGAFNILKEGWELLPNPKSQQKMSYMVLERFFDLCIRCKKFELANKWISLIFVCNLRRIDDGEREFIAGRLAYEQGDSAVARELLMIANIKSEGVIFKKKERKKYIDLLK